MSRAMSRLLLLLLIGESTAVRPEYASLDGQHTRSTGIGDLVKLSEFETTEKARERKSDFFRLFSADMRANNVWTLTPGQSGLHLLMLPLPVPVYNYPACKTKGLGCLNNGRMVPMRRYRIIAGDSDAECYYAVKDSVKEGFLDERLKGGKWQDVIKKGDVMQDHVYCDDPDEDSIQKQHATLYDNFKVWLKMNMPSLDNSDLLETAALRVLNCLSATLINDLCTTYGVDPNIPQRLSLLRIVDGHLFVITYAFLIVDGRNYIIKFGSEDLAAGGDREPEVEHFTYSVDEGVVLPEADPKKKLSDREVYLQTQAEIKNLLKEHLEGDLKG